MAKERRLGGLRTLLAGGPDREGGGGGPVVALLHGFGANAEDLFGLWRVLDVPRAVRFAFPEAPLGLMPGYPSFAWWHLDPKVLAARKRLFGSWEMNWIAYNMGHDIALPNSGGPKVPYLMYPNG